MKPLGPHGLGNTDSSMSTKLYLRSQEAGFLTLAAQKIEEVILEKAKDTKDESTVGNDLKPSHHFVY